MPGRIRTFGAPLALAAILAAGPALAADVNGAADAKIETQTKVITSKSETVPPATTGAAIVEELDDARETVRGATAAIAEMKKNAELAGALQRAKGILIVPEFTKGALIIGGWGGEGVLLSHQGSAWAGPAFYDVGAVTAGAEIGFTSGTMAFLLMTDRAVDAFRTEDTFSMSANAEMTVVDFSKQFKLSTDKSDVVVWSDTEGAFVGAGGSLSDVNWDAEANNAYYRQNVTASQVLDGHVKSESTVLVDAIAG